MRSRTNLCSLQNINLGFILKIFLKSRKFQPRYSYKIYSLYRKKKGWNDHGLNQNKIFAKAISGKKPLTKALLISSIIKTVTEASTLPVTSYRPAPLFIHWFLQAFSLRVRWGFVYPGEDKHWRRYHGKLNERFRSRPSQARLMRLTHIHWLILKARLTDCKVDYIFLSWFTELYMSPLTDVRWIIIRATGTVLADILSQSCLDVERY